MNSASENLDGELRAVVERLAHEPTLLVVTDFDGTIAPLVDDPAEATPHPAALAALRKLAELPQTFVAVISGRSLEDLRPRLAAVPKLRLVGSHGGEFDMGYATPLAAELAYAVTQARAVLRPIAERTPGALIEEKPHGVALHYRRVAADRRDQLVADAAERLAAVPRGQTKAGKLVLEYVVIDSNKGHALEKLAQQLHPKGLVVAGDDVTDEDAFAVCGAEALSLKIGPGETKARMRLPDIADAVRVFAALAEARERYFATTPVTPIDRHGFLSDLRTFMLLDDRANVVWHCFPRLDSSPTCSSIVSGPLGGGFAIEPAVGGTPMQQYLDDSLVLESRWPELTLVDFLDCSAGRPFQRPGRTDFIRLLSGSGKVSVRFAPRFDFGRTAVRLAAGQRGVTVEGGPHLIALLAEGWSWRIESDGPHQIAIGERELRDESTVLELRFGSRSFEAAQTDARARLEETRHFWSSWAESLHLPKFARDMVRRSALVLRGLVYGPNGSIAAAATTSLPENIGGGRNWDYRFCWPRDSALTATALVRLGMVGPGLRLLDWLMAVVEASEDGSFIAPVYTVSGRHLSGEAEISEAPGYRNSRPVRIGNLAANQLQLDVLGPIAELLGVLVHADAGLSTEHLELAEKMVRLVGSRWSEPDHGIWEVRGPQRHYVHSKLMCWYTVEQSALVARYLGAPRDDWEILRDEIRLDIEKNGYCERTGAYVCAYDWEEPDAALLWLALTRFHPPGHERLVRTVKSIEEKLLEDGHLYRYKLDDGLSGREGAFMICLAWLIEALAMQGDGERARELFANWVKDVPPLGLLAEQWDPVDKLALGNYPQAYSHLGLINSALAIEATGAGEPQSSKPLHRRSAMW